MFDKPPCSMLVVHAMHLSLSFTHTIWRYMKSMQQRRSATNGWGGVRGINIPNHIKVEIVWRRERKKSRNVHKLKMNTRKKNEYVKQYRIKQKVSHWIMRWYTDMNIQWTSFDSYKLLCHFITSHRKNICGTIMSNVTINKPQKSSTNTLKHLYT